MSTMIGWALLGFLTATPPLPLDELLVKLGAEELRKERETCAYQEKSLSEELTEENAVEGSIARTFAVTRSPTRIDRQLLKKEKVGDVSSAFEAEPKEDPDARKKWRSAFHPELQKLYRFELVKADDQRAVIRYAPHDKDLQRMFGTAEVDVKTATLRSIRAVPSQNPTFVEEMAIEMTYAETGCGVQPIKVKVRGTAGLMFVKKRFRIATSFTAFTSR